MIKLLSIMTIIVTSVLAFGAIGLGSFAMGQSNISSYQTTNQPNTMGAGGGGSDSSVDSKNNGGALIVFN